MSIEPAEIKGHPNIRVIGLKRRYIHTFSPDSNRNEVIPALWKAWVPHEEELEGRVSDKRFGVVFAEPDPAQKHPQELVYVAGVWATPQAQVPDDLMDFEIPTQVWARFIHKGPLADLHQTLEAIYQEWLPTSNWIHAGLDLEVFGEGYEPDSDDAELEYWIAVEPRPQEQSS